jgi:hypothetical protein
MRATTVRDIILARRSNRALYYWTSDELLPIRLGARTILEVAYHLHLENWREPKWRYAR